jgi:hypothetical protein
MMDPLLSLSFWMQAGPVSYIDILGQNHIKGFGV